MSILSAETLDAVGIEKESGVLVLTITDSLDWESPKKHLVAIQNKINRYLGYIESHEYEQHFPQAILGRMRIDLYFKHTPPPSVLTLLSNVPQVTQEYGCAFTWHVHGA